MSNLKTANMDIQEALERLKHASRTGARQETNIRAAEDVIIHYGMQAFHIAPRAGLTVGEIIRIAADAPRSEARRAFAVLLVHALSMPGLLSLRGRPGREIRLFLERALLNPLRRASYPFESTDYDKRAALGRLHKTIDDCLRPLEPSIPPWIHGIGSFDPSNC